MKSYNEQSTMCFVTRGIGHLISHFYAIALIFYVQCSYSIFYVHECGVRDVFKLPYI